MIFKSPFQLKPVYDSAIEGLLAPYSFQVERGGPASPASFLLHSHSFLPTFVFP